MTSTQATTAQQIQNKGVRYLKAPTREIEKKSISVDEGTDFYE